MPSGGHRPPSASGTRTQFNLGLALPVLSLAIVVVVDLVTSRGEHFDRLLVIGPALAAVTWSVRGTLTIGLLAIALRLALGVAQGDTASGILAAELVLVAVTAAAVWVSRVRTRYEQDLREVTAVAEVVQRVVLRPLAPRLGEVELHLLYVAAAAKARIGGDFYEAVRVPGAVRVMLGDVQGKGLGAVETASVLLGSYRAAVTDAPGLPALADRLEEGLARYGAWAAPGSDAAERFATVLLLEFPDGRDVVRVLSCGHPAPLLQHAGRVRPVPLGEPSLPLNLAALQASRHQVEEVPFLPGDRLLLFTDGVSETRDRAGDFYPLERRMSRWTDEPGDRVLPLLHHDLTAFGAGRLDDDVAALLVVRLPEPAALTPAPAPAGAGGLPPA
ncbi:PP2C family protein-serine/threonine phosphatase [Streptomyces sp. NPDC048718]|uniref:PP2C family protein-serine/threonine phosphatase n=1 Tax=Streptomyces sp. NPDC048718 TaxID=3365587 RepID=UPI00371D6B44